MPTKTPTPPGPPSEIPLAIGGFPVVRLLGEGGMGRVYACRDERLDRVVAVKVLRPDLARVPAIVERFLREARAMARIASPNVVTVHQVGEQDSVPFLVMEMLDGEDLAARVHRKGRLEVAEAVRYVRLAVDGLRDAADAGIIHRDVKPANLFLVDGSVKLTDFGLALPVDADARLTQDGLVVGTPHYLAPELARGGEADEVSDIYSLGATFYELLTGKPPYPGEAALDVVSAHLKEPVPSLKKVRNDVPDAVDALLQKMMAKKVAQRFSSYGELAAHLDHLLGRLEPFALSRTDPALSAPPTPSGPLHKTRASGATPSIKTASLTIMVVDIAGYTERTSQSSREEAARWLALHDELVQPCIRAYRGKLVKTIGDALLVTFSSTTDAISCATAVQDRLFQHNQGAPSDDHIHARVVLSAGEVRVHKGDVLGEPVNIATRLEKLAHPGQVLFSDAVYAGLDAGEVKAEALGEHTFKGIRRGVIVYRAVPVGIAGAAPYGGRTLARVEEAQRGLGQVKDGMKRALDGARGAVSQAGGGARVMELLRGVPPLALAGASAALVVALGLAYLLGPMVRGLMSEREAKQVLATLDSVPRGERSAADEAKRALALESLGDVDEALAAYARAAKGGIAQERALALAFEAMEQERADRAVQLVEAWPAATVNDALVDMLDDDWWPRHNALLALEKRGVASDEHRTSVGVEDLLDGESCGQRRYGLLLLKRGGAGTKALEAIKEAGERMPDNVCMSLELAGAEKAVSKRGAP